MVDLRALIFARASKIIPGIAYNRVLRELSEEETTWGAT